MSIVYLGLGSNLGDQERFLLEARREIVSVGTILAVSSLYTTEPVGFLDQPWFLNQVVKVETGLEPQAFLHAMQSIEGGLGRERTVRFGPRTIDIDVLLFDDLIIDSADLMVPHPRLAERRFVLEPLNEIGSQVVHPVLGKTVEEMLADVQDKSRIERMSICLV